MERVFTATEWRAITDLEDRQHISTSWVMKNWAHKRIFGPLFEIGEFYLACSEWENAEYIVVERWTNMRFNFGAATPALALEKARQLIRDCPRDYLIDWMDRLRTEHAETLAKWEREEKEAAAKAERKAKRQQHVPKRRREVFEKSSGSCHYCGVTLDLTGRWHIEHRMPRALLGGNDLSNLVASCPSCNHAKRDKTEEEFVNRRKSAALSILVQNLTQEA